MILVFDIWMYMYCNHLALYFNLSVWIIPWFLIWVIYFVYAWTNTSFILEWLLGEQAHCLDENVPPLLSPVIHHSIIRSVGGVFFTLATGKTIWGKVSRQNPPSKIFKLGQNPPCSNMDLPLHIMLSSNIF